MLLLFRSVSLATLHVLILSSTLVPHPAAYLEQSHLSWPQGRCLYTGNSYIESPDGRPDLDDLITVRHYDRTQQQAAEIGLLSAPSEVPESQVGLSCRL